MKKLLLFVILSIWSANASYAFDHEHSLFNEVLSDFVKSVEVRVESRGESFTSATTQVDYEGLKKEPEKLEEYLGLLSAVSVKEYEEFFEDQKLSFLINAYNAFTLKLIIDHYPIDDIRKVVSLWRRGLGHSAWKIKFFELLGEKRHLDWVEHEKIRVDFDEPRIHFAVNCASVGCPSLRTEPFVGERLERQLQEATTAFLKDESRNRYDSESEKLYLSQIFNWYGEDFKSMGGYQKFVASRLTSDSDLQEEIRNAPVEFLDYDWTLNQQQAP